MTDGPSPLSPGASDADTKVGWTVDVMVEPDLVIVVALHVDVVSAEPDPVACAVVVDPEIVVDGPLSEQVLLEGAIVRVNDDSVHVELS